MCAKVLFPFLLALPVKSVSTLNRLALMPRLLCLPCLCQLHAGASASCYCQQMASCQLHPSPPARTSAEPAKLLRLSSAHNFSPRPVLLVAWLSLWCQVSKAALTHLMSAVPYLCLHSRGAIGTQSTPGTFSRKYSQHISPMRSTWRLHHQGSMSFALPIDAQPVLCALCSLNAVSPPAREYMLSLFLSMPPQHPALSSRRWRMVRHSSGGYVCSTMQQQQ